MKKLPTLTSRQSGIFFSTFCGLLRIYEQIEKNLIGYPDFEFITSLKHEGPLRIQHPNTDAVKCCVAITAFKVCFVQIWLRRIKNMQFIAGSLYTGWHILFYTIYMRWKINKWNIQVCMIILLINQSPTLLTKVLGKKWINKHICFNKSQFKKCNSVLISLITLYE